MGHRDLRRALPLALAGSALVLVGCSGAPSASPAPSPSPTSSPTEPSPPDLSGEGSGGGSGEGAPVGDVTLGFAGDMHFELHLAALLDRPAGALGPITEELKEPDVTMVNLESAITERGVPEPKELEDPAARYHFRTSPKALEVLDSAGVDVVTVGNNHGADYGPQGLRDTLEAKRRSPIGVVGVGADRAAALAPYRVNVRGTDFAFFGADASMREGKSTVWAAGPASPGVAAARAPRPKALLEAVRAASQQDDVVVVYLHWGAELEACPTRRQRATARALAEAGADVVVGSHAHVLLGSGWLGDTYVNYGLGNFLWYHNYQPTAGLLQLHIRDGEVVRDTWVPTSMEPSGRSLPLRGGERRSATEDWRGLARCAGLALQPGA